MRILALAVLVCLLSGCYMEDRESMRPEPTAPDVMGDLQASADDHPLAGWSR